MKRKNILILGASGRDWHNFLVYFRNNPQYQVVGFTQAQIPGIEKRSFPKALAGRLYKKNIPFYPEEQLAELIPKLKVDEVVLAYSDLSHQEVMNKASIALAAGANFRLLGPKDTQIKSKKPLIAICATRTGAGKGTIARKVLEIIVELKLKPVVIRHPMPYLHHLEKQVVQRFKTYNDLKKQKTTIEEREEYEPYINQNYIVYAGIDYRKIIKKAEKECDIIVFESGNNDLSFFKPDIYIVVADPLRMEGLYSYPGEANIRLADVIIINKCNATKLNNVKLLIENIRKINPKAPIIKGNSVITVDNPELIKGKTVLVIEDSPTITHGSLRYSAGYIAAKKYKSKKIINPKLYAIGVFKEIYKKYPHIKNVLPSTGYNKKELEDLEKTINNCKCDTIVLGTPCDIAKVIKITKPVVRVNYKFEEIGKKQLVDIIKKKFM